MGNTKGVGRKNGACGRARRAPEPPTEPPTTVSGPLPSQLGAGLFQPACGVAAAMRRSGAARLDGSLEGFARFHRAPEALVNEAQPVLALGIVLAALRIFFELGE